jgi:hypothetical protein
MWACSTRQTKNKNNKNKKKLAGQLTTIPTRGLAPTRYTQLKYKDNYEL